jgi:tRNA pseudouridine55 synthase
LLVDKPAGISSHDVVAAARRVTGESRIGHGGTLDPFATGLLVLLLGRATRLLQYLHDTPKVYDAVVHFGTETDTEDHLGSVVLEAPRPTREALDAARPQFVGTISQVPPAYSAKRVDGQRAYALARAGHEVELEPVEIEISELTLSDVEIDADGRVERCRMRVRCGSGTYIRSIARDLARACGSAAHLTALRRSEAGRFNVADAVTVERLRAGHGVVRPALDALAGYPEQGLSETEVAEVVRGIDVAATVEGTFAALTTLVGGTAHLVAFAERRTSEKGERFQPRCVMREAAV